MARRPTQACDPDSCRLRLTVKFPKAVTPCGGLEAQDAQGGCEEGRGGAAFVPGG